MIGVKLLVVGGSAKLASGRPQDLADVDAIRKAAESQRLGTR